MVPDKRRSPQSATLWPYRIFLGEVFVLAKEIKRGAIVTYQDGPCLIESISVQSPSARGASTLYKFRGRNLISKQKIDFTLKGVQLPGWGEIHAARRSSCFHSVSNERSCFAAR